MRTRTCLELLAFRTTCSKSCLLVYRLRRRSGLSRLGIGIALVLLLCHTCVEGMLGPDFASKFSTAICRVESSAPAPRSSSDADLRQDIDQALSSFWRGLDGYCTSKEEDLVVNNHMVKGMVETGNRGFTHRPSTYGEITPVGIRQLGRAMGIDDIEHHQPSYFIDLGSGVGKLVVQAYLEWPQVIHSVGVELAKSRVGRAREAWTAMVASGEADGLRQAAVALAWKSNASSINSTSDVSSGVHFIEGDMFEVDVSKATHVYIASLCFDDVILGRLADKLSSEASNLLVAVSLRRFPDGLAGFHIKARPQIEMSWTKGSSIPAYIYESSTSV